MDEQESINKLKIRNKIFVAWPVGIASICLGLVVPGFVSPLWGVVLGLAMVVLLWLTWILGQVLADRSAKAAARAQQAPPVPSSAQPRP